MLQQKTIWITGASSGIGEGLALALSHGNNNLILSARRVDELNRVKANCGGDKDRIMILPMDMNERTGMTSLASQVKDKFGVPDVVILNAGISNRSYIKDTSFDVFQRVMDVNFFGNVSLSKAVIPHFIQNGGGRFVIISSLSGKFASPGRGAYASSKHALHGYFDTLRMEHHRDNIKVLLVCPGFVQTKVTINSLTGDGKPQGKLDKTTANGMLVSEATARIIRGIERDKQEISFGGRERIGLFIKRFFPSLLNKIVLMSEKEWKLDNTVDKS